ncbi:hypothetical protein [Bacillus mobilis]
MVNQKNEMKAGITHVREIVQQSEIIKKINDSKSVGTDCKVGVLLDGKVSIESVVNHTPDSIRVGVVKGSEMNGTN